MSDRARATHGCKTILNFLFGRRSKSNCLRTFLPNGRRRFANIHDARRLRRSEAPKPRYEQSADDDKHCGDCRELITRLGCKPYWLCSYECLGIEGREKPSFNFFG